MSETDRLEKKPAFVPIAVRSFVVIVLTAVLAYKMVTTPCSLQFDFAAFLSLLLALFSVGLAALFYFKATDTSNTFYNHTYRFTKEIAELLVRIESSFGEKLDHLDQGYKVMQEHMDRLPQRFNVKDAEKELKAEEKELKKALAEREKLIEQLATKAQLRDEEKEQFIAQLDEREKALSDARREMALLRHRLRRAEALRQRVSLSSHRKLDTEMVSYLKNNVIDQLEREYVTRAPSSRINRRFQAIRDELPERFIQDMEAHGLIDGDGDLAPQAIEILKEGARERTK